MGTDSQGWERPVQPLFGCSILSVIRKPNDSLNLCLDTAQWLVSQPFHSFIPQTLPELRPCVGIALRIKHMDVNKTDGILALTELIVSLNFWSNNELKSKYIKLYLYFLFID